MVALAFNRPRPRLAYDRASVRSYDTDGRLHVAVAPLSKACVNPYIGHEIPNWEALGLDPSRTYYLFRDPKELAKAVDSFNNLPVLSEHVPVNAEDHGPDVVVGSTGTDARWTAPYITNSLVVWAQDAIAGIEDGSAQQISSAYRYTPIFESGTFAGQRYDARMTDISASHVALVPVGRAGPDVVIGDSFPRALQRPRYLQLERTQHGYSRS
jgi:hypothetical protein